MKKLLVALGILFVISFVFTTKINAKTGTPTAELLKSVKVKGIVSALGPNSLTVNNTPINVTATTILLHKYGAKAKLSEFSVGDEVVAQGNKLIRNMSTQKRRGVFLGKITSVSNTGFVLTPEKRPAQTVGVNLLTKYVGRGEKPILLKDIKVNDKVMVKGLWDTKLNTITEVTFVRDYSPATSSGKLK